MTEDEAIPLRAAAIERERLLRSQRMTLEQRLLAGPELFESATEVNRSGIRADYPHFTEAQVWAEQRRRLAIGRKLEAHAARMAS